MDSQTSAARNSPAGGPLFYKPRDIQRLARVPYRTVLAWLRRGHPTAGVLPSFDLAGPGRRHSYRVRREDWEAFLARLRTPPPGKPRAVPLPRPADASPPGG